MGAAPPILVADNDPACRQRLAELLERIGYATAQAATGAEALELAARLRPGVALLEVNLPEISGYEVCHELRNVFGTEMAIIFLSGDRTTARDRVAGLLVGADDYVVKPFDDGEFLARVRAAVRRVPQPAREARQSGSAVAGSLTTREREVLGLLARGLDQSRIAADLFISPKTVGGHIQRILTKLEVHSRAQAVALAHEQGLVGADGNAGAAGSD